MSNVLIMSSVPDKLKNLFLPSKTIEVHELIGNLRIFTFWIKLFPFLLVLEVFHSYHLIKWILMITEIYSLQNTFL